MKATIAEALKAEREKQGLSQDALAKKAGLSRATVATYEQGRAGKFDVVDRLCRALRFVIPLTFSDRETGAALLVWNLGE